MLELPAAPEAHHVHVRLLRGGEQIAVARRRLAALEGVARNPVRALAEDLLAVHAEGHARALPAVRVPVRRVQHLDRAEADFARQRLSSHLHLQRVEVLRARTVRPPELRVRHVDREGEAVRARRERNGLLPGTVAEPDRERRRTGRRGRHLGMDRHRAARPVRREILVAVHVVDARVVHRDERDGATEARHHLREPPVPAAVALRLADQLDRLRPRHVRNLERAVVGFRARVRFVLGAPEDAHDAVVAGLEEALHVEVPAAEAVVGAADLLAVDLDGAEGVHVLQAQRDALRPQEGGRDREGPLDPPVLPPHVLRQQLVLPEEGIGNLPGREQGGMDVARNLDRHGELHGVVRLAQMPHASQVHPSRRRHRFGPQRERRRHRHRHREEHFLHVVVTSFSDQPKILP